MSALTVHYGREDGTAMKRMRYPPSHVTI